MQNFNQLIQSHPFEIKELLREYGVISNLNENAVLKAVQDKGSAFTKKLIDILNNPDEMKTPFQELKKYDNYQDANGNEVDGPPLPTDWTAPTDTPTTGGLNWLSNILQGAGMLGNAYAQIKADITGQLPPDQIALLAAQEQAKASQSKSIMYVAGGLVVIILIVLLVKSRS